MALSGNTLVIAEPPPHATIEDIRALDPAFASARVYKHSIGIDGWVKDVVIDLPPLPRPQLAALTDTLQLYLFGTTYKADVLDFSEMNVPPRGPTRVDLRVTAADLYRWSFLDNERFSGAGRAANAPLQQLLATGRTGVYYSQKPGLILWVLPRKLDIAGRMREARQFAVDSDLILGAVTSKSHFAIVARERVASTTSLPPLRFETIRMLSEVTRSELAQSYERKYIFAGNYDRVTRYDWAPIYLSPELIDSEYGSLLNITDQMLKSWTESGRVRYKNFDYPDPAGFPFGQTGMDDNPEVTYNWNTTGVGYRTNISSYGVLALNRTGALAVSYITGLNSRIAPREERAYKYFAELNNPELTRVVQYAALYQMFRELGIRQASAGVDEPENPAVAAMADIELGIFDRLRQLDIAAAVSGQDVESMRLRSDLQTLRAGVIAIDRDFGDEGLRALATRAVGFREAATNSRERIRLTATRQQKLDDAVAAILPLTRELSRMLAGPLRVKAKDAYLAAWIRPEQGWIRTASIVESRWAMPDSKGNLVVGGHNLNSRITRFTESSELPPGKVALKEVEGNRLVVEYSRADRAKAHELVRVLGRQLENPDATLGSAKSALETTLAGVKAVESPRSTVLSMNPGDSLRSFQQSGLERTAVAPGGGTRFGPTAIPAELREVAAMPGHAVILKKPAGTYEVVFGGLNNPIEVKSMPALMEQLTDPANLRAGTTGVKMHLAGFSVDEGDGLLRNLEFRAKAQNKPLPDLMGIVEKDGRVTSAIARATGIEYDFSKAKISDPTLRLIEEGPMRGTHLLEATLEVPSRISARPSLWMRVKIFFSERVPTAVRQQVQEGIQSILARLGNERAALHVQARQIHKEIMKLHPNIRRVELELNDYYITKALQPDRPSPQAA